MIEMYKKALLISFLQEFQFKNTEVEASYSFAMKSNQTSNSSVMKTSTSISDDGIILLVDSHPVRLTTHKISFKFNMGTPLEISTELKTAFRVLESLAQKDIAIRIAARLDLMEKNWSRARINDLDIGPLGLCYRHKNPPKNKIRELTWSLQLDGENQYLPVIIYVKGTRQITYTFREEETSESVDIFFKTIARAIAKETTIGLSKNVS